MSLLHLFSLPIRAGLSHIQDPSKIHAQSVAVGCTPVGFPIYAWCATSGPTAAEPGSIPQQTTSGWPHGAAPLQSHMLHPPGIISTATWSILVWLSRPGTSSPSGPSPSDQAHLPRRAPSLQDLPLNEAGFCSSIATASNTATQNFTITRCWSPVCKRPYMSSQALPPSGGVARPEAVVVDSSISVSYRGPDGDIGTSWCWHGRSSGSWDWPRGNHIDLRQRVYFPRLLLPPKLRLDFDSLLEDCGDQMVLGNFNTQNLSWSSRTEDDRAAARGEALVGVINSSQHAVMKQDLHTCLPSQGLPSSPEITFLSGHLLPDATWSTLTTLGSDHPITVSLSSQILLPRRRKRVL